MTKSYFSGILTPQAHELLMSNLKSPENMFWTKYFPLETTDKLTYEAINEVAGMNVAAFTTVFGSEATEAGYQDIVTLRGDIDPISIKRIMKEKEIILLEGLTDTKKKMLMNKIYNNSLFVKNATFARLNFYAMQLLSNQGVISLTSDTNAGHAIKTIDYGLESWQKPTASTLWSVSATAKPFDDIQTYVDAREDKGYSTEKILMGKTVWNAMRKCASVSAETTYSVGKKAVKGNIVTLDAVNIVLNGALLPEIEIVDDKVQYLKSDGTVDTTKRAWNSNNISFISGSTQGVTLNAPTAEMLTKTKGSLTGISDGVTIQQYGNEDPVFDTTKAKMNAMTAWGLSNEILTAKVL